jgi:hypothetical protein
MVGIVDRATAIHVRSFAMFKSLRRNCQRKQHSNTFSLRVKLGMMPVLALSLAGSLISLGCVPSSTSSAPLIRAKGEWLEIKTPHFTVRGQLPAEELQAAAQEYEAQKSILEHLIFGSVVNLDLHTKIILFHAQSEFEIQTGLIIPQGAATRHLENSENEPPTLILAGQRTLAEQSIFIHEMTHRILRASMGTMPPWFEEGAALYYGGVSIEKERVVLGEDPREFSLTSSRGQGEKPPEFSLMSSRGQVQHEPRDDRFFYSMGDLIAPSEMLKLESAQLMTVAAQDGQFVFEPFREKRNYVSSWLFVHFLMTGPKEVQKAFRDALLAIGEGANGVETLNGALKSFDPKKLDSDYYLHAQHRQMIEMPLPPTSDLARDAIARPLDAAEIQALNESLRQNKCNLDSISGQPRERPEIVKTSDVGVLNALDTRELFPVYFTPSTSFDLRTLSDTELRKRDISYMARSRKDAARLMSRGAFCPRGPLLCGEP